MPPASRGFLFLRLARQYSSKPKISLPSMKDVQAQLSKLRKAPLQKETSEPLIAPKVEKPTRWTKMRDRYFPSARTRTFIATALIMAPPLALFSLHFPLEIMYVNGASMSPLLNPHSFAELPESRDSILVQKMSFPERNSSSNNEDRPNLLLQRGQIVVFRTPHSPEKIAVKRVVALAGDRVEPLPGYPGGEDSVIIPYHHIWVEGDVNDRDKSIDSNWYGPITQNLVIGKVNALLTPFYSPTLVKWEQHAYPAKINNRVEVDVVGDLNLHPDATSIDDYFGSGIAKGDLEMMQRNRVKFPQLLARDDKRTIAARSYAAAKAELAREDPKTVELARALVKEFEGAFAAAGLTPAGGVRKLPPAAIGAKSDVAGGEKDGPARRALLEYLEKQKRERDEESSQVDERRQGWVLQAKQMQDTADQARQKSTTS